MKVTLEISADLLRRAKIKAAEEGIPLAQFVTNAISEKLLASPPGHAKAILKLGGKLRHLKAETARINKLIEDEFERIEPEDWA
ncbi:MAG: hypothetical protein ACRD2G_09090 [Terriglobia bacterium]